MPKEKKEIPKLNRVFETAETPKKFCGKALIKREKTSTN